MSNIKREFVFKAVLMGEGSVGKTSIRSKFMGVGFKSEYIKTIGADFASKAIILGENKVHFQIWDLAGQKMYKHVRSSFYSGCKCGFLVFDLTAPETLEKLDEWVDEALEHSGGYLKIFILLGNKRDLLDEIKVKNEDVNKILEKIKKRKDLEVAYMQTSALTGENISEAFEMMGKMFLEKEGFPRQGAEEDFNGEFLENSLEVTEAPKEEEIFVENDEDKVIEILNNLNTKITRLTEIMNSLEERILLMETKRDCKNDLNEIIDLREKIENLDKEVATLSNEERESMNGTNDLDFLVPVPTMDDIKSDAKKEQNFEKLDLDKISGMEVIEENNDEENITKILNETEAQLPSIKTKEQMEDLGKSQPKCQKCGGNLSFIKHYNRWYCYRCKIYV